MLNYSLLILGILDLIHRNIHPFNSNSKLFDSRFNTNNNLVLMHARCEWNGWLIKSSIHANQNRKHKMVRVINW